MRISSDGHHAYLDAVEKALVMRYVASLHLSRKQTRRAPCADCASLERGTLKISSENAPYATVIDLSR